jgi:predicted nucleotidyltransferase
MDKSIVDIASKFARESKKVIDSKMVILYGSYARGNAREDSDIDIAVIVDDLTDDYLDISSRLFSLVWDIDSRIEPVLLSAKDDKSGFLGNILKYGYRVS